MRILSLVAMAVLASACGSSGYVKVQLTDAPLETQGIKQVIIEVSEVRVRNQGDNGSAGPGNAGAEADDSVGTHWIVLCSNAKSYDLMQLRNGVTVDLCQGASTEMVTGQITDIRLGVTKAELVFNDDTRQALKVPSGATSGLKVKLGEPLAKDQTMTILVDFDAEKSVVSEGNGKFILKPVITAKRK